MNFPLFIFLLFALQVFYWIIGCRSSFNVKGQTEYFLAGKSVKFFPLMMTFLATQVGGGIILGAAEEAYRFGWPVLLYPLGAVSGLILLGCGLGSKLAGLQVSTVAQIFEIIYGSVPLRKVASLLSVISLFMILVAQIIASHKFLVSMGMDHAAVFVLFWAFVIVYTAQGGLKAVIATDVVQAAFFSAVFLLCFGYVLLFEPSISISEASRIGDLAEVSSKLWGWLLMPLLFMLIEQDMGQRCFAGASSHVVSKAAFWAGICTLVICIVPVFLGSLARIMGVEVPTGGSVLMAVVARTTNPWITALVGCAILAAIISTATSLINAISSNLSSDFSFSLLKSIDPMKIARGGSCLISLGAIFFAFYFDNIVDILIQSYELSVSCLFVPVVMALFIRKGHAEAAFTAIGLGAVGFFLLPSDPIPKEIAGLCLSFAGYGVGTLIHHTRTLFKQQLKGSQGVS